MLELITILTVPVGALMLGGFAFWIARRDTSAAKSRKNHTPDLFEHARFRHHAKP